MCHNSCITCKYNYNIIDESGVKTKKCFEGIGTDSPTEEIINTNNQTEIETIIITEGLTDILKEKIIQTDVYTEEGKGKYKKCTNQEILEGNYTDSILKNDQIKKMFNLINLINKIIIFICILIL